MPRGWIKKMKRAMKSLTPTFSTHRMVEEYMERFYTKAAVGWNVLSVNNMEKSAEISGWKKKILDNWHQIKVMDVSYNKNGDFPIGSSVDITVDLKLGNLSPSDVMVDAYFGQTNSKGEFINSDTTPLKYRKKFSQDVCRFSGGLFCDKAGSFSFTIRVMPFNYLLSSQFSLNLVLWG